MQPQLGKKRWDEEILPYFPIQIRTFFQKLTPEIFAQMEEIRFRARQPLLCVAANQEYSFTVAGAWTLDLTQAYRVSEEEIQRIAASISEHSRYAFEEEIRRGFITLPGGHRVGLSGQVLCDGGKVRTLRCIGGLAFRIARECLGCADSVIPAFYDERQEIVNVLIISPPRCGKTTLLRDICRQLSDGNPYAQGRPITVVDERSEIAGSFRGVPQLRVGCRTDVLDGCPKAEGMVMALRSLAPSAIITDEISRPEDAEQLRECIFSGVSVITSVHASNFQEARNRPGIRELLQAGFFQRAVVLSRRNGPGTVEEVVRC